MLVERGHLLRGPTHPVTLAAAIVLLLNDHLFKSMWPGLVTGKLSDVAWLIVTPVWLAAVLALAGVARARIGSIAAVAIVYTLLQIWPPLGDAWAGFFGWHHVADVGDLLALPALLVVPLCWRGRPARAVPWGRLAFVTVASVATSWSEQWCDARHPEDGAVGVDPNGTLGLAWADRSFDFDRVVSIETGQLAAGTRLVDEAGQQIELLFALRDDLTVIVCPKGGLEPGETYQWWVDNFADTYTHNAPAVPYFSASGWTSFTTAEESFTDPVTTEAACRKRGTSAFVEACHQPEDTGLLTDDTDTGDP